MSSPIEKLFADALLRVAPDPKAITFEQYPSPDSHFRIDFAVPAVKRGVELDGFTYHEGQGREKATADKARERELDRLGWKITRFSGDEIRADAEACAREWLELCGISPKRERDMLSELIAANRQEDTRANKLAYDLGCALSCAYDKEDRCEPMLLTMADVRDFISRGYAQPLPEHDGELYVLLSRNGVRDTLLASAGLIVRFVSPTGWVEGVGWLPRSMERLEALRDRSDHFLRAQEE